ncbi:carotenoid ester lipase precursor [Cubamyces sp. BRFM 1775]|nr:carotenoid ester lipase precursor [Cubamyces sp. BRFM 1775]
MHVLWLWVVYVVIVLHASALPTESTITLDKASVIGVTDGDMTQYLGIPFAQPPVGNLRLQLPRPLPPYTGVMNATTYGYQCIQPEIVSPTVPDYLPPAIHAFLGSISSPAVPQSEDCLTVNVIVPAGTKPNAKLPVAAWIYGGGYVTGSNAVMPGEVIVNRSMALGQPVVYVSMNYRVGAFGFLGGREIMKAGVGNLGLQDQRAALRWIQKYISQFGGDPTKVTMCVPKSSHLPRTPHALTNHDDLLPGRWGESAGSQSVAFHMVTNGGDNEGLFRAGWMESGTVQPAASIESLQPTFDAIASAVGCTPGSARVLDCLRAAPADAIKTAMDEQSAVFGYSGLSVPWSPRVDGVFLKEDSAHLALKGEIADVPIVVGDCEDEGTLFSIPSLNITTDAELAQFLKTNFLSHVPPSALARVLELYPADPAAGSPFGTGDAYNFTREYKRLAAFQGDLVFQGMRRFFLAQRARWSAQPAWSFMFAKNKVTGLGTPHSADLADVYGEGDLTDFLIRFVNTLDPNPSPRPHPDSLANSNSSSNSPGGDKIFWPKYNLVSKQMLLLVDEEGEAPQQLIADTFREEAIGYLNHLGITYPQ